MALKTSIPSTKSRLRSWLFNEPAKFAALSLGLFVGLSLIYTIVRTLTSNNSPMSPTLLIILMTAALVFSIYKLICWLPKNDLDRRSFIAVDNGLTLIYFLSFFLSTIFLITSAQQIVFYMMMMQYYSMMLFFVAIMLASLIYLYVVGLLIANMYAIYRRALTMGVPKWKALLSFPFASLLLWMPGYLLPEKSTAKPAIEIKSKWYSSLTNWVVSKPINAILAALFMLMFSALFFNFHTAILALFFGIVFGIWVWVKGTNGFRKSIGGAFATFAASLNIAMIIICIGFFSLGYNNAMQNDIPYNAADLIQVADAPTSVQ